ncbi:MAG: ATP synthase F1 subunit delta [Vicinamibacterales bacterium]
MSSRASAARYARALFDVAVKESNPEQIEQELSVCVELLRGHPELQRLLTTPGVPVAGKRRVLQAVAERAAFSPPVGKLLLLLADRDRLGMLPDVLAMFRERLMEQQQVVRAEVTTATPLSPDGAAELQQRLNDTTGRRVTITTKVDPSIIGGVVARLGSTVYDGSVAAQLTRLRERLAERG